MCLGNTLIFQKALQAVYPDYVPASKPRGYWKDKENQKKFFDQLAVKWNIQNKDDWNQATGGIVVQEGGRFFRKYYGSLQQGTNILRYTLTFEKRYRQFTLIMYQQRSHEDIGKTKRSKKSSLINWP
jgi:hypothetical protein